MELFPAAVFNPSPASRARTACEKAAARHGERLPLTARRADIDATRLEVVRPPAPRRTAVLQACPEPREMAVA